MENKTKKNMMGSDAKETPRGARDTSPRELVASRAAGPSYPNALDLVSRSPEWRTWLDAALRQVLAPAALVGAVGLAGFGCDGSTAASLAGEWVAESPHGAAPQAPIVWVGGRSPDKSLGSRVPGAQPPEHGGGGVLMSALPGKPSPPTGGPIAPPPDPPRLEGEVVPVRPTPPVRPPTTRGGRGIVHARPRPAPPVLPGRIGAVHPDR